MHAILIPARPAGWFCPTFYQEKVGNNKISEFTKFILPEIKIEASKTKQLHSSSMYY